MPPLSELLTRPEQFDPETHPHQVVGLNTLQPWAGGEKPQVPPADAQIPLSPPTHMRCPLPALGTVNPDSLRQFYRNDIPQFRVLTSK
jgi:hypothetical protein